MSITVVCPQCGSNLRAPPEATGLQLPCPRCSAMIQVPGKAGAPTLSPPPAPRTPRPAPSTARPAHDRSASPAPQRTRQGYLTKVRGHSSTGCLTLLAVLFLTAALILAVVALRS